MAHIIENARGQVFRLLLNVNRNPEKYVQFQLPVIGDCKEGYTGPLAGILSAMKWCARHDQDTEFIVSFPGDVPWFPRDIVERLATAVLSSGSETACVRHDGQIQPLFSLWSMQICCKLEAALQANVYSPMQFIRSTRYVLLESKGGSANLFLNINHPEDLEEARRLSAEMHSQF